MRKRIRTIVGIALTEICIVLSGCLKKTTQLDPNQIRVDNIILSYNMDLDTINDINSEYIYVASSISDFHKHEYEYPVNVIVNDDNVIRAISISQLENVDIPNVNLFWGNNIFINDNIEDLLEKYPLYNKINNDFTDIYFDKITFENVSYKNIKDEDYLLVSIHTENNKINGINIMDKKFAQSAK